MFTSTGRPPPYPVLLRIWNVVATRSGVFTFSLLIASVIFPPVFVAAVLAAMFFGITGRVTFESNRKYVMWLGRKVSEQYGASAADLVKRACNKGGLPGIVPLSTREIPTWYTPRRLKPVAEAFLEYPGEVVVHLVNRVLPDMPASSIGSQASSQGLAGDLMMTFERMYLLNPTLGDAAATMLALAVMTSPTLGKARATIQEIGMADIGLPRFQREECTEPDHRMHSAVQEVLIKMDPVISRLLSRWRG